MASQLKKPKKMGTKSTNSVGDSYWINAAKQFPWPIDLPEKVINVPHNELELAEQDLMVEHFRNNGWHIQSCIEVIHTKPFVAPVSDKPIFKPLKPVEERIEKYKLEQKFRILSSDCEVKVVRMEKGKVQFKYLNRNKPDLLSSEENLDKALRLKYWEQI